MCPRKSDARQSRFAYANNNPSTLVDPSGNKVKHGAYSAGFCVNSFGGVAGGGTATGCLVKDNTGRRAFLGTYGVGAVIPWSPLTFAPGFQFANARIDGLLGIFAQMGGSRQISYGAIGIDVATGKGLNVVVVDVNAGFSLSLPKLFERLKGEFHVFDTNTVILSEDKDFLDAQQFAPVWALLDAALAVQGAF